MIDDVTWRCVNGCARDTIAARTASPRCQRCTAPMTYYGDPAPPARLRALRIAAPFRGYIQILWAVVIGACVLTLGYAWRDHVPDAEYDRHADGYDVSSSFHPEHHGKFTTDAYYSIEYRFRDTSGVEHTGVSTSSSRPEGTGSSIEVEYRSSDPSTSRAVGGHRRRNGTVFTVLLFACLGSLMIAASSTTTRREVKNGSRPTLRLLVLPIAAVILCVTTMVVLVIS